MEKKETKQHVHHVLPAYFPGNVQRKMPPSAPTLTTNFWPGQTLRFVTLPLWPTPMCEQMASLYVKTWCQRRVISRHAAKLDCEHDRETSRGAQVVIGPRPHLDEAVVAARDKDAAVGRDIHRVDRPCRRDLHLADKRAIEHLSLASCYVGHVPPSSRPCDRSRR